MRSLLVIALLMAGCATPKAPLPTQPEAPTEGGTVKQIGQDIDARSNKVAAAVTVVKENADKPHVVAAEAGVALGFLPTPSPGELAIARQRVASNDGKAYQSAAEEGKRLLAKINADLNKALADQAEAKRVSDLKDRRITELEDEVERVKREASANLWTMAGVGIAVVGAIATAFVGPKVGIPLLLSGAAIGAFPFVVDSEYFSYIAGGSLVLASALGIWYLWDIVRDKVHQSDEHPKA